MARRPAARRRAERFGRLGELVAAMWLVASGYRIRAMRARTPVGEIDLVASRGTTLAFVEVKSRRTAADRDVAFAAVNRSRIASAAAWWLAANPRFSQSSMRFDVIGLAPMSLPRHVKGAFDADDGRRARWR
jgi:putative endonuclease